MRGFHALYVVIGFTLTDHTCFEILPTLTLFKENLLCPHGVLSCVGDVTLSESNVAYFTDRSLQQAGT